MNPKKRTKKKRIVRPDKIESLNYPVGEMTKREVHAKIISWCKERRIVAKDLGSFIGKDSTIDKDHLASVFKEAIEKILRKYDGDKEVTLFHLVNGIRLTAKRLMINQMIASERRESEFGNSFGPVFESTITENNVFDIGSFYESALNDRMDDIKKNLRLEKADTKIFCSEEELNKLREIIRKPLKDRYIKFTEIEKGIELLKDRYSELSKIEKDILTELMVIEDRMIRNWLNNAIKIHRGSFG
jgi:hypothetical protein